MSVDTKAPVPLRVVAPPQITATVGEQAPSGTKTKDGLLAPLGMRERLLVCAIADALAALRDRAEAPTSDSGWAFHGGEKAALLGLLVAFKDATGCAWVDAEW